MSEEGTAPEIPEWLSDQPYFKPLEDGTTRTKEQIIADLQGVSKMQGDLTKSHMRMPDKDDAEQVSTAKARAMEGIPGLTVIPGEDDVEGQAAFYKSIGRPDAVDGYKLPEVAEGILDGVNVDSIREQALADGWTQKQFSKFIKRVEGERVGMSDAQKLRHEENRATLKKEWGEAFDDKRGNVSKFLEDTGADKEIKQAFTDGTLEPGVMKWLNSLSDSIASEDSQLSGQSTGNAALTPSEANEQLPEVERRLYAMKPSDPNYRAMIAKQERLLRAVSAH